LYPGVSMHRDTFGDRRARLIGSVEAAQAARVGLHVISNWRNKGWTSPDGTHRKLPVAGYDRAGRPLYRYVDVLDAERETRRSGKSHRRHGPPQPDWDALDHKADHHAFAAM